MTSTHLPLFHACRTSACGAAVLAGDRFAQQIAREQSREISTAQGRCDTKGTASGSVHSRLPPPAACFDSNGAADLEREVTTEVVSGIVPAMRIILETNLQQSKMATADDLQAVMSVSLDQIRQLLAAAVADGLKSKRQVSATGGFFLTGGSEQVKAASVEDGAAALATAQKHAAEAKMEAEEKLQAAQAEFEAALAAERCAKDAAVAAAKEQVDEAVAAAVAAKEEELAEAVQAARDEVNVARSEAEMAGEAARGVADVEVELQQHVDIAVAAAREELQQGMEAHRADEDLRHVAALTVATAEARAIAMAEAEARKKAAVEAAVLEATEAAKSEAMEAAKAEAVAAMEAA
eukprot:3644360-Pleurochrysis_carterae.AAC.1